MKSIFVTLGFLLIMNAGCKKSGGAGEVCFTRNPTNLVIENKSDLRIYWAAFPQSSLPLIDWSPTCTTNSVAANSSFTISLSSIMGSLANDALVVYWWECPVDNQKIKSTTLSTSQSICK